jgi:hypothetical protein
MPKVTLFLIVISFIFSGCSSNTEQKKSATTKEATKQVSLNFDQESFQFSMTTYAAEDKSYKITGMTFTDFTVNSPENALNGTSIEVKLASLNSTADLNNGKGGMWPESMAPIRDNNVINGFIKKLTENETATAKIVGVSESDVDLEVNLNGVTKVLIMPYSITEGVLTASASADVLDFNAAEAFKNLEQLCAGYHYGKTWSDVDLSFSVKVQ